MNRKKLIACISILLILTMLAGIIAGCGGNDKPPADTGTKDPIADSPDNDNEVIDEKPSGYVADYLPEKNFGDYEFRMVSPAGYKNPVIYANVEEESGDTVSDAIYKRNRLIEETYGIKFRQIEVANYEPLTPLFTKSTKASLPMGVNFNSFPSCNARAR